MTNGIIVFYASFAPPSLKVKEQVTQDFVSHVDIEENNELVKKLNIEFVPTVVAIHEGKEIMRVDKYDMTLINGLISDYKQFLKLKELTTQSRIVAFIKGTKQSPKCGFTRQLLTLLQNQEYTTFDILSDPFVRQWLKVYSDWPTFPQVYVDGEFIGGLDIIQQMPKDEFYSVFESK